MVTITAPPVCASIPCNGTRAATSLGGRLSKRIRAAGVESSVYWRFKGIGAERGPWSLDEMPTLLLVGINVAAWWLLSSRNKTRYYFPVAWTTLMAYLLWAVSGHGVLR
jgi:hypothetical protein